MKNEDVTVGNRDQEVAPTGDHGSPQPNLFTCPVYLTTLNKKDCARIRESWPRPGCLECFHNPEVKGAA